MRQLGILFFEQIDISENGLSWNRNAFQHMAVPSFITVGKSFSVWPNERLCVKELAQIYNE